MQSRYINPYTDFGFKRIFGQEANKDILISFLNALLPPRHQVADLRFLNTERVPPSIELHAPILDLFCESLSGEQFIVEMQKKSQMFFFDRSVYYTACAVRDQVERGRRVFDLAAVYFIGIMDFTHSINDRPPRLVHEVSLKDQDGALVYDKLHMFFIQMPLFDKGEAELATPLDKWLYFLKNLPGLDRVPEVLGEPVFTKAFKTAEESAMSREDHAEYRRTRDSLEMSQVMLAVAKDEGLAEGEAKGLDKGRAEGLAEGEAKGETKARLDTARKLKALGLPVETITVATGIPAEEIDRLTIEK